jgi:hypothetical protein
MQYEKLRINRFIGNISSSMHKILFLSMEYVYEVCNPTIINLSIVKKKISLGMLDYRPKSFIYVTVKGLYLYVYFFVTSTDSCRCAVDMNHHPRNCPHFTSAERAG